MGQSAMVNFRLYALDGKGHVVTADWFEAKSDAEAIVLARMTLGNAAFEIWDGGRLVAQIGRTRLAGVGARGDQEGAA